MNFAPLIDSNIAVIPNARLADHTTFQLGGPCKVMIVCRNAAQITLAVSFLRARRIPFVVMGFGSNILASDHGIDQVVVRYASDTSKIEQNGTALNVDAGTPFDVLADFAVTQGLEGLTLFSGIPGTVGGALAGNAGAYGTQLSDYLVGVTLLMPDNTVQTLPKNKIRFDYRDSDIKHNGSIILSACFQLLAGDVAAMTVKRNELIAVRHGKHGSWETNPCAGSFFRNVDPTSKAGPRQSAGWFLEQSGCKALSINGAHAYENHANIITHDPNASAQDVLDLTIQMQKLVKARFGIDLIREVRLLGRFKDGTGNPNGYW